jgi:hypothetical protein
MINIDTVEIRDIGSYLSVDEFGFLSDDFLESNLQERWVKPCKQATDIIVGLTGECLVSVYLRGSVANGTAIDNISDIDLSSMAHH